MEELGLNPRGLADCEVHDDYLLPHALDEDIVEVARAEAEAARAWLETEVYLAERGMDDCVDIARARAEMAQQWLEDEIYLRERSMDAAWFRALRKGLLPVIRVRPVRRARERAPRGRRTRTPAQARAPTRPRPRSRRRAAAR